jgi:hypothetical protein
MPKRLPEADMHHLARLGAIARLKEIDAEAAAIRRAFPGLGAAAQPSRNTQTTMRTSAPASRRRKWKMSPTAREAARKRMHDYWVRKKAETPASPAEGSPAQEATDKPPAAKKRRTAKKTRAKKAR